MKDFIKKPPMGWNSWDCYGAGVTEDELLGNAEFMRDRLKQYGYQYVVCDIQWYGRRLRAMYTITLPTFVWTNIRGLSRR